MIAASGAEPMGFYLIALAVVLTDQVTKEIVVRTMRLGQSIPIVPGYFDLTYVLNPGAAFSLLATLPEKIRNPFFIAISVAAAILITVYPVRPLRGHRLASVSLGLILGGYAPCSMLSASYPPAIMGIR